MQGENDEEDGRGRFSYKIISFSLRIWPRRSFFFLRSFFIRSRDCLEMEGGFDVTVSRCVVKMHLLLLLYLRYSWAGPPPAAGSGPPAPPGGPARKKSIQRSSKFNSARARGAHNYL